MSSPVLLKLTRTKDGEHVTVNMARVLFLEEAESGTRVHMNIPDTNLEVVESQKDIREMTIEHMGELP